MKPKILLITDINSGMINYFSGASEKNSGMPAFYNVYKKLKEKYEIDHILLGRIDTVRVDIRDHTKLIKIKDITRFSYVYYALKTLVIGLYLSIKNDYKFIYGMAHYSFVASLVGMLTNKPHFRRIFGSFLLKEINDKKWRIFLRHPFEYLSWILPSYGTIVTNDGTGGDKIGRKLGSSHIYFLRNGIKIQELADKKVASLQAIQEIFPSFLNTSMLCVYSSRLEYWKRVDRSVELMNTIEQLDLDFYLLILGSGSQEDALKTLIEKYHLSDRVKLLGNIPQEEALSWVKTAEYFFSFFDVSNIGNSFIEAMFLGKIMVTLKDQSTEKLIVNGVNGLKGDADDIENIAGMIRDLQHSAEKKELMKKEVVRSARGEFPKQDERIQMELDILSGEMQYEKYWLNLDRRNDVTNFKG